MKNIQNIFQSIALAQIKPSGYSATLLKTLLIALLIAVFFSNTSYMGGKRSNLNLRQEIYQKQMHNGLVSYFKQAPEKESGSLNVPAFVSEFYQFNGYNPVWTLNHSVNINALTVIELLDKAENYGLNRKFYHIHTLLSLKEKIEKAQNEKELIRNRNAFELLLTDASLSFMIHLNRGIISYDSVLTDNSFKNLPAFFYEISDKKNIHQGILSLQPSGREYKRLQKGLEKYLKTVRLSDDTWSIPAFEKDQTASTRQVKKALTDLGYLSSENITDSVFTEALKNFQLHHGLTADGKITKNTREAFALSTRQRFHIISINLDRIRKTNRTDNDYVLVNIPSYKLRVIKNDSVDKVFTVVVGNPKTPTPEFDSKIDKIIANPDWNVPVSIIQNEILPKVKEDSSYITRHNFKVVDKYLNNIDLTQIKWNETNNEDFEYYFIQNSGNSNSLGLLKFTFKNPYSIYIHDTPSKKYFASDLRAFSHGCIRLQNPELLAQYLIDNNLEQEVKPDIKKIIAGKKNEVIELSKPLDIYIRYFTCEADENYDLYFYRDIYNKDNLEAFAMLN